MIERIGNAAERLAANVSQSRRGFLARLGQAALGAAGALGALLALPGAAQAGARNGHCTIARCGRSYYYTGYCVTPHCTYSFSSVCSGATGASGSHRCGTLVGRTCSF